MSAKRLRDLGLAIGHLPTGPLNAITDVEGVRVGHVTIVADEPHVLRTGVTVVHPLATSYLEHSVFAGFHNYNGFGEVAGTHWLDETGVLTSPICLSSTFSFGVLRDALLADPKRHGFAERFHQPAAGETFDGVLSDGWHGPVQREHVTQALDEARPGPVAEGCVGSGTGMISFGFKAGIGTSSRVANTACGAFTVGVLVQSNFGVRSELTVDGVPVGRHLEREAVDADARGDKGSIVIIAATDAPLMSAQCRRLAKRACIGLARVGGFGANRSGDFALAFSTANRLPFGDKRVVEGLRMLPNEAMNPLFRAAAEATEEAIVNSMIAAETMAGVGGTTVRALPHDRLIEIMARYGRGPK